VGAIAGGRNSAGGVDFADCVEPDACNPYDLVFVTADAIKLNQPLPSSNIYGVQILPAAGGGLADSWAVDFDNDLVSQDKGANGDVEIVRACADIVEHEEGCDYEVGLAACSCTNTQAYAGVDGGCGVFTSKPICVSDEGREISASVGGSFCALCVNTQQADWVADQGCPPDKPMCVCGDTTPDLWFAGTQCVEFPVTCVNTAAHGGMDEKCDYDHPICVGPNGKPIDSNCYGEACVKCVNSQQSDDAADYGCTADKPRCLKTDGNAPTLTYPGDVCSAPQVACINNGPWMPNGIDQGCTDPYKQICVKADGGSLSAYGKGDKCVKCINTYATNSMYRVDEGCSGSKPRCVNDYGSNPAVSYTGTKCMY
jgi:hypothetical protein